jgi:hypothetical protein
MEFLEISEVSKWAEVHGLLMGEEFNIQLPALPLTFRDAYAEGRRSGREQQAAKELIHYLGIWNECLVWITGWGVWPSSEDWPKFYAWRGSFGERRSLNTAPGQLFEQHERQILEELLIFIMENAWDANILCSVVGRADKVFGKISHDELYEVFGEPTGEWAD